MINKDTTIKAPPPKVSNTKTSEQARQIAAQLKKSKDCGCGGKTTDAPNTIGRGSKRYFVKWQSDERSGDLIVYTSGGKQSAGQDALAHLSSGSSGYRLTNVKILSVGEPQ